MPRDLRLALLPWQIFLPLEELSMQSNLPTTHPKFQRFIDTYDVTVGALAGGQPINDAARVERQHDSV